MVPHRQVLQVISLATLASPTPDDTRDTLCRELNVKFPCTLPDYLNQDIFPWLTPDVEALLRTTDFKLLYDYRPLFAAAKQLDVAQWLCINAEGPWHNVPATMVKWRANSSLRIFIETALLCEIPCEQIAEDVHLMYGISIVADDVTQFKILFMDEIYATGNNWLVYAFCIGDDEAKFKRALIGQPKDYVRWRLGVPIELNSERVINRLLSDAYFTLRLLKGNNPAEHLTKDQMQRIKLENDVIWKGLDRRVKLAEIAAGAGGHEDTDAAEAIKKIVLAFQDHKHVNKKDIVDGPITLDDLNKEA